VDKQIQQQKQLALLAKLPKYTGKESIDTFIANLLNTNLWVMISQRDSGVACKCTC